MRALAYKSGLALWRADVVLLKRFEHWLKPFCVNAKGC
jgi:hypothetical protein